MGSPARALEPTPPPAPSLKRRAVRGTLLSVLNVGGVQILRLVGNLITTRLLFPEAYGLMLMVLVLVQGLHMISDVGILPSIIQHERGEERDFLDTAWTMQLLRGGLITLLGLVLAWPYAQFYGQEELLVMILVASSQGIISGFESTKLATLNRRIELGRLVFVNVGAQVLTLVVMVVWAYVSPSVWALLAGALVGDVVRMVLSHVAVPGPNNRFRWEPEAAKVIFHFGKWIFVSTLVTYLGMRFDALALGKLIGERPGGLDELGVYNIGQNLAGLPALVTGQVVLWVLLPALSESFREDRARFFDNVRRARRVLNAAGVLMVAGTAIGAPAFFYLLYDARYHDAGWMVQLLMLSTWFFFLQETSVRVEMAMGRSRSQMIANLAKLAGTVPGALGGYFAGLHFVGNGMAGLLLGLTIGSIIGYVLVAISLRENGLSIVGGDMKWTALGVMLAVLGGYTPWVLGPVLGVDAQLLSLGIGTIVIAPYGAWTARMILREIRRKE